LTAALACDGQIEEAKAAWVRAWETHPLELANYVVSMRRVFKWDEDGERFIEALKLAGAPFE